MDLNRLVEPKPQPDAARTATFGPWRLDLRDHLLFYERQRVALPGRAAQVLALLVTKPGELVTRQAIWESVWVNQEVDLEANLNTAIGAIRRAFKDSATDPEFVETIPRQGYRFLKTPLFSTQPALPPATSSLKRLTPIFLGTMLIVAGAWVAAFWRPGSDTRPPPASNHVASPGYAWFLKGNFAASRGEIQAAEAFLNDAIKADPRLAPAYVSLARIRVSQRRRGWQQIESAQTLVEQALAHEPGLVAAHTLKAGLSLYYWRHPALARKHVEQALALGADDPDALVVKAYLHIIEGQEKAALEAISRAHALRPLSASLNADYGWVHYKAGNWNDAERLCKTSVELNPDSTFALECVIHVNHSQGDFAEAADFGLMLMQLRSATESEIAAIRKVADARSRERAYWEWTLDWLNANRSTVTDALSKRGVALCMLDRGDEAVASLTQAFDHKAQPFLAFLAVDPRVDSLRNHAQFDRLAQQSRTPLESGQSLKR